MTEKLTPTVGVPFDLALLASGFEVGHVKELVAKFVAFAKRPTEPDGGIGGGLELGFSPEALAAMEARMAMLVV